MAMEGSKIADIEKELENIYNEMKKLAASGPALERFQCFNAAYQRTRLRERTTLVFCGKTSTGKSTIMRALTGDDGIAVGVGETTNRNREFLWGDGLLLVDTPGIFTDTAANVQEARRAMDEADMIAYCVSPSLFDHIKNETGYFRQLLQDYRDKLFLCVTKCPRTSSDLYFNIQSDIYDAIGEDAYYGTGETDVLSILLFDAKDYIEGRKNGDEGLIQTSNFQCFLNCINGFSKREAYASRCATRLRQMRDCLGEILETIPCLSQEDRELSKAETAELNRIEEIRQRAYANIKKDLHRCEIEIMSEMQEKLCQDDAAESIPQMKRAANVALEQTVDDILDKIRPILENLEINVQVNHPETTELKIDGSDITKGMEKNIVGKRADKIMAQFGDTTANGVKAVAEIAKQETVKRRWWQFWKKAPEVGGKGTLLYQHLSGSGIGQKLAPQIGKCAVFLEKHQAAMQGSFAAVGIGIDLIQEIRGERNEKKRQAAIKRILQDFDANIRQIVDAIIEDIQESIDRNCQEAMDTIHNRLAARLGHDTPEDRVRRVALALQSRIGRLQEEVQNGGRA